MMSDHAQKGAGDYHYGHEHHDHAQEKASSCRGVVCLYLYLYISRERGGIILNMLE